MIHHSLEREKLYTAFSKAQGELKNITKDKKAKFAYASMEAILESVLPILSKNGLTFQQYESWEFDRSFLVTEIGHESGQWMCGYTHLIVYESDHNKNGYHNKGTALSYYRRYAAKAMLGISDTETDNDGDDYNPHQVNPPKFIAPEYISKEQLDMIESELDGFIELAIRVKKSYNVTNIMYLLRKDFNTIYNGILKSKKLEYGSK